MAQGFRQSSDIFPPAPNRQASRKTPFPFLSAESFPPEYSPLCHLQALRHPPQSVRQSQSRESPDVPHPAASADCRPLRPAQRRYRSSEWRR